MGTTVVGFLENAEKAASTEPMSVDNCRDLDKAVVHFLQARIQFHRLLGHVEATMLGKAEEMEALETYVRTQPKLGGSRRKRRRLLEDDEQVAILQKELEREVAVAALADAPSTTTTTNPVGGSGDAESPLVLDD
jgi:hypothetical protein